MDGYIKKSEAVDVIVKYPYDIAGKTATAIKMIEDLPSADVVPKSELDMSQHLLKEAWKRIEELDELCGELQKSKTEVAREIFEEIGKEIDRGLSVIEKILNTKGGRANGKTVLLSKYDVYREAKKYIAELKKKYTEGNQ